MLLYRNQQYCSVIFFSSGVFLQSYIFIIFRFAQTSEGFWSWKADSESGLHKKLKSKKTWHHISRHFPFKTDNPFKGRFRILCYTCHAGHVWLPGIAVVSVLQLGWVQWGRRNPVRVPEGGGKISRWQRNCFCSRGKCKFWRFFLIVQGQQCSQPSDIRHQQWNRIIQQDEFIYKK